MFDPKVFFPVMSVFLGLLAMSSGASAFEINSRVVVVDGLQDVEDKDGFAAFGLSAVGGNGIQLEVATGGGCKPHDYTLHVSSRVLEAAPPIVEARLTLDKHADRCKAIVSGTLHLQLPDLGIPGPYVFLLKAGPDEMRMMMDGGGAPEALTTAPSTPPLALKSGTPASLGDPLSAINSAEIVAGVDGATLLVSLVYDGGCEEHGFEAWWDGSYDKSLPPRAGVLIFHDAGGDACRALVNKTIQIAVDDILEGQGEVIIDVHGLNVPSIEATLP